MQQITVLCVGRLKEAYLADASAEYQKRLQTLCRLQIIELPARKLPDDPAPAQIAQALEKEGAALLQKIPPGAAVVALCVEGITPRRAKTRSASSSAAHSALPTR